MRTSLASFFAWVVWSSPDAERDDDEAISEVKTVFASDQWNVDFVRLHRAYFETVQRQGGSAIHVLIDRWPILQTITGARPVLPEDVAGAIAEPCVDSQYLMDIFSAPSSQTSLEELMDGVQWFADLAASNQVAFDEMNTNRKSINDFLDPLLGL